MKTQTNHYFNVQQRLYSNQELSITDKFILAYIVSIYESTNNFYMSDKKLAENLGTTIRTVRYSIDKLKKYDWFFIDTNANISKDKKYIGKTRSIIIDVNKLNNFLTTKVTEIINEEPKELPQVELSNESDIQVPQEVQTPAESLKSKKTGVTNFINNKGKLLNINLDNVDYFTNVIFNNEKFMFILKQQEYDEDVNEILYMIQKEDLINNN